MTTYETMDGVEPLATEFLLPGLPRIPKGDATVVYGDGSIGKGRLVCSWIAQVINSDPTALVIVVLPEDHPSEQVAPRLMEAGVSDLSRVVNMTRMEGGARFKLSASASHDGHIGIMRSAVQDLTNVPDDNGVLPHPDRPVRHVAMIILDPIAALIGWGTIGGNAGVRRMLEPIQDLSADFGIATIIVAHPVSGGKLQGSMGFSQAARAVYRVHIDPNNRAVRLISSEKTNNQGASEPVRFTIEDDGSGPRVVMLDSAELAKRQASWRTPPDSGAGTAILTALRDSIGGLTIAQISDMTGVPVASARTLLWRMGKRGQIRQDSGLYEYVRHSGIALPAATA